jgi:hypothetical protein
MIAMPNTTMIMPDNRNGLKVSPNTMLDAPAPTNGTTCAAV